MSENKSKKVYVYDFPENRQLAKGLIHGDYTRIGMLTNYTPSYVRKVMEGKRRMPKKIRKVVLQFIEINKAKMAVSA